jgi:hypothetical protein
MLAEPGRSRRTWSEKTKFAPGSFGFRNACDKGFLKSPKDGMRALIPETGLSYQKSEETQIKTAKSRSGKNRLEWKSPCFILSGRSAAW